MATRRRPGPGWAATPCCAVFEHVSGIRIHIHGMARLPTGEWIDGGRWPESKSLEHCIRICGGNRRRGVMAWTMKLASRRRGGR